MLFKSNVNGHGEARARFGLWFHMIDCLHCIWRAIALCLPTVVISNGMKYFKYVYSTTYFVKFLRTSGRLVSDQKVTGSILGSAIDFSLMRIIPRYARTGCFSLSVSFAHSVLCCLRRRSLHSAENRSEEVLQLSHVSIYGP